MEKVALKKEFGIEDQYFETFVMNPEEPVRKTNDIREARIWEANTQLEAMSKARSFAEEMGLKDRGFRAVEVNR